MYYGTKYNIISFHAITSNSVYLPWVKFTAIFNA